MKLTPMRLSRPIHNVKTDFGANNLTGDGLTNDATKLNAIIAASSAGDRLYFPEGTYLCASAITAKDGVHWRGPISKGAWVKGKIIPASDMGFVNLKLGDDSTSGFGRGGSGQQGVTHHMTAANCDFIGTVCFQPGDVGQTNLLRDSAFVGCTFLTGTHGGNGVNLYVYGDNANSRVYNVDFRECVWEGSARINAEITCYAGDPEMDFAYPWYNINFYDCDFGPSNGQSLSICGRRAGYWAEPYSGAFECGYGTMSGCYVEDAGVNPPSGTAKHAIELAGTSHYTITDCVVGRNRDDEVTGTHFVNMIDLSCDALGHKWVAGYNNDQYNVITNNIFDGSLAPESTMTLKGNYMTFSGNTLIQRVCQGMTDATDGTVEDNDIRTVNSDGSLSTSAYAFFFACCKDIDVNANTFRSKNSATVLVCTDWTAPTGPSTNIAFVDNTFVKDAADARIEVEEGSSITESGSIEVEA